jgi:hypothetical protein
MTPDFLLFWQIEPINLPAESCQPLSRFAAPWSIMRLKGGRETMW